MPESSNESTTFSGAPNPSIKAYLDVVVARYEQPTFIERDPVSILHGYENDRDREVIGLFTALLAWGRRDIMLRKMEELSKRMRFRPYDFVSNYSDDVHAEQLRGFVHRTFRDSDAVWLCKALQAVLHRHHSLDRLCATLIDEDAPDARNAIQGLSETLLGAVEGMPTRMRKHLPRPDSGSACKRLNLYFRWMVRSGPVDLGIWQSIRPGQLLVPLDLHSGRQARTIGLLSRKSNDWKATVELTEICRTMCPEDPARYDFAFFGTGEAGETLALPDSRREPV